jgi:cell division septal protein FtsQ
MANISDKYKRDYKGLDYSNPRLAREKENRRKISRRILWSAIGLFVVLSFYFIFFSPFFAIQGLDINGLERIKKENITKIIEDYRGERKFFVFSRNNFWLLNSKELKKKILEKYWCEQLDIMKKFPNRLEINLKEKNSAINWLANNQCYHLDLTGLAIEYCEDNKGLLTIRDLLNTPIEIGKTGVAKAELDYLVDMDQQLKLLAENNFKIFYYEKQDNSLTVKTEEPLVLLLNMNLTVEEQLSRLGVILNEPDVKNNLGKLSYIDLRFGEKVYYK